MAKRLDGTDSRTDVGKRRGVLGKFEWPGKREKLSESEESGLWRRQGYL